VQLLYAVKMDSILRKNALALASTYMTEQWGGSHVFKVGTKSDFKMFAILNPGKGRLTVKTPDADVRAMLIEVGLAEPQVHLPRGNWMVLLLDKMEEGDVLERLKASYELIFPTLPKRVRAALNL